jgi:DNA-binding MarR family transcriptional regulator
MPHTTTHELAVLHALRLRGFAEPAAIGETTGIDADTATMVIDGLAADGLVTHREGRISGWTLTPEGRDAHARLLADERADAGWDVELEHAYEQFVDANDVFKRICTDWQLRTVDGEQVVNDHSDPTYDAAIAERLEGVHTQIVPGLDQLATTVARFATYPTRLREALDRFRGGDPTALARPLSGSYHDVWMELHEDLLLSLGRERSAADGH